ncbi:type IV pilus assembly protein PilY1 [Duganella sp. CF402]|uniref:pilus assembly protein n=1 Tax=unclassified Duganella TaxID=2636909 RepID=UPI0008B10D4D|nr:MULTISPECIES: PilC/PilY family type IV pilus protein [unclassified Duganella]RZT11434.1 type IV pilus assembly protein PilY1 [Duganella sp. BK701]SEK64692.1 type IV pilus assembly protein PilY1 [Duganella sp. CF402]
MKIRTLLHAAVLGIAIFMPARADPPTLVIDSWPIAADCKSASSGSGAVLLRPAPFAASSGSASSASAGDVYQATMNIADWGGHFSRYVLSAGVGATPTSAWDAGAILTGTAGRVAEPTPALRQIYTSVVKPDGVLAMAPFTWAALSPAQQALLNLEDHAGEQRVAYLRGERTLEGVQFRRRSSILGDAVHSTPVYVDAPGRRAAIYLGANDGMLHAFDAASGIELFAYVPDALIAQLHYLTDPAYVHRAYVDGPASAGEANIAGSKKAVLLSAMGGGATGVFALDVTDPARFADGLGAIWEFTSRDDPLMGNVTTIPQIARVRVRRDVVRDFAIVASGFNNGGDGKGALFLLALDKPHDQGWRLNRNYYRITTPVSDSTVANALSAPVLLNDNDGVLRYAYAGDLQGNLWRFDFSGSAPWPKAIGKSLFVARDASGRRQSITQRPLLAYASNGYMILFGTGRLIALADRKPSPQSYYAIIDSLQAPPDIITGRHQLTQRFLDGRDMRMAPGSKGWYIDFTEAIERSINTGMLTDGVVLFNTVLPGADMCSPTSSRSYALKVTSGLPAESSSAITGETLPDYFPLPALLPQTITRSEPDPMGRIAQEKTYAVVGATPAGPMVVIGTVRTTRRVGRLSWREIVNWRELHEAAK